MKGGENMKKILGISILSVFALSLFAMPALVSAATCAQQCDQIYGAGSTAAIACQTGCTNQGTACYTTCQTTYPTGGPTLDACKKGCFLTAAPITASTDIEALVTAVARWISIVVSVIAVIFIILGGVSYITAGGDAEKATGARQKVVYGLIGLAIAALAWGAEALVRSFLALK